MTNGGLLQLVAYGAQDVYLTANPQVTFFKQLYRRHSNFAMESIEQTFNGVANFGKRVTCTIARNGDLIHKVYLQATLPAVSPSDVHSVLANSFSWVRGIGKALVKQVELEIGGQLIDRQYGEWLHIWNELTLPTGKQLNYNRMTNAIGGIKIDASSSAVANCDPCAANPGCTLYEIMENVNAPYVEQYLAGSGFGGQSEPALPGAATTANALFPDTTSVPSKGCVAEFDANVRCLPETTLYVPLEFWFCRHTGLALPLIALQYHEVKINLDFQDVRNLINVGANINAMANAVNQKGLVAASLWVDYIYLDTEERRRFAQVAHEYLIEQLQFTGTESLTSTSNKVRLQFNHPVKELVWVVKAPEPCDGTKRSPFCFRDQACDNPTAVAKLQLNGQDRFQEREGGYFNFVQPYQHHTNSPQIGINVYSFALKPEDLQPSGTCNFSRIDNATLNLTLTKDTFVASQTPSEAVTNVDFRIYATNYNVLRIMSGMGGLAYSN